MPSTSAPGSIDEAAWTTRRPRSATGIPFSSAARTRAIAAGSPAPCPKTATLPIRSSPSRPDCAVNSATRPGHDRRQLRRDARHRNLRGTSHQSGPSQNRAGHQGLRPVECFTRAGAGADSGRPTKRLRGIRTTPAWGARAQHIARSTGSRLRRGVAGFPAHLPPPPVRDVAGCASRAPSSSYRTCGSRVGEACRWTRQPWVTVSTRGLRMVNASAVPSGKHEAWRRPRGIL